LTTSGIAVIDDDPVLLEILQQALPSRLGMSVMIFPSGEDYLEFFKETRPAVVLLDAALPGIQGIDVLKKIRERYSARELPVLFISADSGSAQVVNTLESGANDFVGKPIDIEVLAARIKVQLVVPRIETDDPRSMATLREGSSYLVQFLYCQVVVGSAFARSRKGSEIQTLLAGMFEMFSHIVERYRGRLWLRKDDAGFFAFVGEESSAAVMCAMELLTLSIIHGALQEPERRLSINLGVDAGQTVYRADPAVLRSDALNRSAHMAKSPGRGQLRISQAIYDDMPPAIRRYFSEETHGIWIYTSIF